MHLLTPKEEGGEDGGGGGGGDVGGGDGDVEGRALAEEVARKLSHEKLVCGVCEYVFMIVSLYSFIEWWNFSKLSFQLLVSVNV